MYETTGIITYNPIRNVKNKWWLTVELPYFSDTAKMYRWFMNKHWYEADSHSMRRPFNKPPHKYHVSIIRGETPRKNRQDWGKYLAGKKIKVGYSNLIRQTSISKDGVDHFWFVDSKIDVFQDIRKHFGLQHQKDGVPFKGHITIARTQ